LLTEDDFAFLGQPLRAQEGRMIPPRTTLQEMERPAILPTLDRTHGDIKEAATVLGIDRSTLYDKTRRYEIPR
jgi:transcriptional regulator of acetoin/glycerol metabolism